MCACVSPLNMHLSVGARDLRSQKKNLICKAAYTLLVYKLHRVQEPICEHNVRIISTYKRRVCKQCIANDLHQFFNEHKGYSQFSGYSVARCMVLAVNIRFFGKWYGRTAQC